jgi:Trp operon repressor
MERKTAIHQYGRTVLSNGTMKRNTQPQVQARREQVAALIRARISYRQISRTLHVGLGTIGRDAQSIISEWRKSQIDDIEKAMLVDLEVIDEQLRAIYATSCSGDLKAIETSLKLMERRAKIFGYDAAIKMEHGGKIVMKSTEPINARIERYALAFAKPDSDSSPA